MKSAPSFIFYVAYFSTKDQQPSIKNINNIKNINSSCHCLKL